MEKVMYLAIDVDDKSFTACGLYTEKGIEKSVEFKSKPSIGALDQKLSKFKEQGFEIKVCYEATYLGFSLYRDIVSKGYACEVIAPSSIPRAPGHTVKTDRVDARKLVEYYKKDLLTLVQVPDAEVEVVRSLCRSRIFLTKQLKMLRKHILSNCRQYGMNYKGSEAAPKNSTKPAYFTATHTNWLESVIEKSGSDILKFNLKMLLTQMQQINHQIASVDSEIEKIAEDKKYKNKVDALVVYRGIDVLTAMVLITELGDIKRFSHPSKLVSYVGFDLREYSSGGRERRYGISKMGNSRVRWLITEASQSAHRIPAVSKRLRYRRENKKPEQIEIADRCMKRLYKKANHLVLAGKPINKVKVACAREMLCFVWESLNKVAA
ncbi:MAG: IS110 family transposase [Pseudobdellovibrionaceae bacterium]